MPGGAQQWATVAVDVSQMWRCWIGGKECGCFLPDVFQPPAPPVACLIRAGHEDQPCFWPADGVTGARGRGRQHGLPILYRQRGDVGLGGFGGGVDDGCVDGGGEVGFGFFNPTLEVGGERELLLGGNQGG